MDVVITHDFAENYGGAERVTEEMALEFPDAPVWGILGRSEVLERMGIRERWHSILRPREGLLRHYRRIAPLYPMLVHRATLPDADMLLTSSYAFAHHFRTANRAPQVCYCHSPLRFAWSMTADYRAVWAPGRAAGPAFDAMAGWMRLSDRRAAACVSLYLTQSAYVAAQIERSYARPAKVIGAPVDCERFRPARPGRQSDYFLLCGRLIEPYKKPSLAVEAFRGLPHRLVIAGEGPALAELRELAPGNVEFVGHLEDGDLVALMQGCAAALFPSRDDFGLIPLETMACGRPVLAFAGGGARQTVVPGVTGEFFSEQTVAAIRGAVRRFDPGAYDPERVRAHAEQWDRQAFRRRLRETVEAVAG
jgi:glycosyltransferase involved in cell wall biosynthesis